MSGKSRTILVGAVILLVAAAIIGGLILVGPPSEERGRRLDRMRVNDLRSVARALDLYWTRHQSLPASLEQLSKEPSTSVKLADPETALPYEYQPRGQKSYALCAEFAYDLASEQEVREKNFWSHGSGRVCFELEASTPSGRVRIIRE